MNALVRWYIYRFLKRLKERPDEYAINLGRILGQYAEKKVGLNKEARQLWADILTHKFVKIMTGFYE